VKSQRLATAFFAAVWLLLRKMPETAVFGLQRLAGFAVWCWVFLRSSNAGAAGADL